jgi:peptidoglycan/LPS O-acetylase OafA/YrhL
MRKFDAIEGLRGWLAWAVVFSHLAYMSALKPSGFESLLKSWGRPAVLLFVVISGFVITHLVMEKPEPYRIYLLRRFARIFPLFAFTCFVGFFTSDLLASSLTAAHNYGDSDFSKVASDIAGANHKYFWSNFLAHAVMLNSAIGDTLLPYSEYVFNPPAWSLSLEWQFYLVAPFFIALAPSPRSVMTVAVLIALIEAFYNYYLSAHFIQLGFLPAAAGYFAIGVASRLVYPSLAKGSYFYPICALAIILFPMLQQSRGLLIWAVIFAGLAFLASNENGVLARLYRVLLTSRPSMYFGSRSYSIYLCHYSIISVLVWLWVRRFGSVPGFVVLSGAAVLFTILTSECTYRYIELPGIALGRRIAELLRTRSQQLGSSDGIALARSKRATP